MMKLGKEIQLGQMVKYGLCSVMVVMNGKTKGIFTHEGFKPIKQRTEYLVVA